MAGKPFITGKAKVGRTLMAHHGAWTKGTKLAYQWFANGKKVQGATKSHLHLTKALKGKKISVHVTGSLKGYRSATKASAATSKVQ
jgi:hypothetical protein